MATSWPDIPFDESMLGRNVIIHCPEKDSVEELFGIFAKNKVRWAGNQTLSTTFWHISGRQTCYRITKGHVMRYGSTDGYSDPNYNDCIKCTFYGVEPDIEVSDDKFEAILHVGGDS